MVVFPFIYLLNITPVIQQLIAAMGFFVAIMASIIILFGTKCYHIWAAKEADVPVVVPMTFKPKKVNPAPCKSIALK